MPPSAPAPSASPVKGKDKIPEPPVVKSEIKKTQKKYKFRLLVGMHVETEWIESVDPDTGRKTREPVNTIYQADKQKGHFPTIETDTDLEAIFNTDDPKLGKKYQRIHGSAVEVITDPTKRLAGETVHAYFQRMDDLTKQMKGKIETTLRELDKMTQDDLVALAITEEIDLSSCATIDEVRKTIRDALTS
jgi:hypothetical protein